MSRIKHLTVFIPCEFFSPGYWLSEPQAEERMVLDAPLLESLRIGTSDEQEEVFQELMRDDDPVCRCPSMRHFRTEFIPMNMVARTIQCGLVSLSINEPFDAEWFDYALAGMAACSATLEELDINIKSMVDFERDLKDTIVFPRLRALSMTLLYLNIMIHTLSIMDAPYLKVLELCTIYTYEYEDEDEDEDEDDRDAEALSIPLRFPAVKQLRWGTQSPHKFTNKGLGYMKHIFSGLPTVEELALMASYAALPLIALGDKTVTPPFPNLRKLCILNATQFQVSPLVSLMTIRNLSGFPKLESLWLAFCQTDSQDIAQLRKIVCQVIRTDAHRDIPIPGIETPIRTWSALSDAAHALFGARSSEFDPIHTVYRVLTG